MTKTIIYRHPLNRAPTQEDRVKKIGFERFLDDLVKQGWVAKDRDTALQAFKIAYEGHPEPGNNYVEWRAIPRA
jgi:hypothetical protein